MKARLHPLSVALISIVLQCTPIELKGESRTFVSTAGTAIEGELVSVNGDMVTLKKVDGQTLTIKSSNFSPADIAYLQAHGLKPAAVSSEFAKASKERPFVNSLGMKFVPVPGTKVLFCTTITRIQDYNVYAAATGVSPASKDWWKLQRPGPVLLKWDDSLSWEESKAFCVWLGAKEGCTYRLPTDREWSIAIGIGNQENATMTPEELNGKLKNVYPWGTQWPPPNAFGNYGDESFRLYCKKINYQPTPVTIPGYKDGELGIAPVGMFQADKLGLYDMSGNLWQWCEDWFDAAKSKHYGRGGCWTSSTQEKLLSSARETEDLEGNISFRCVIEVPGL